MKLNTTKKIAALTYLAIFLFGLSVPFATHAADKWYYIEMDQPYALPWHADSTTGSNTEEECNKARIDSVTSLYKNNHGDTLITKCFKHPEGTILKSDYSSLNQPAEKVSDVAKQLNIKNCTESGQVLVKGICTTPETLKPEEKKVDTKTTYTPLAPLPGLPAGEAFETSRNCTKDANGKETCTCPFGNYLNIIIKLVIGIAAVLAMVMIVMGGIEYMTTELVSGKENGKDTIRNAILGLLIALGAYLILNTINPQLLSACLDKLPQATITILPFDATINSYVVKTNSASCKIMTNGDCTPANLKSYFGNKAENASKICSVESGGKPDLKSGFDYCSLGDKVTFSFGLFQINLLANGDKIPKSVGSCANLFTTSKGEEIGYGKAGYIAKENGKFKGYDCKLKTERGDDYKKCRDYLLTAAGNLEMAKKLFNSKGNTFKDWQASDSVACPSAFQ